jgi:hypothetical protein
MLKIISASDCISEGYLKNNAEMQLYKWKFICFDC